MLLLSGMFPVDESVRQQVLDKVLQDTAILKKNLEEDERDNQKLQRLNKKLEEEHQQLVNSWKTMTSVSSERQLILDFETKRKTFSRDNADIKENIYRILCKIYMGIKEGRDDCKDLRKTNYPKNEV